MSTVNEVFTILQLVGAPSQPSSLADSVLLIIDAQREYVDGKLALPGIEVSLAAGGRLLARARAAGTPVVHVLHRGAGPIFNPATPYYQPAETMLPLAGEAIVEKTQANAFAGTGLQSVLEATGRKNLIVIGYMTHNCVSSTVVAAASGTRALPDGLGGVLSAEVLHAASLIGLSDTQAVIVRDVAEIPD